MYFEKVFVGSKNLVVLELLLFTKRLKGKLQMPDEDKNKTKFKEDESMIDIRNRMILQTAIDGFCVIGLDGRLLDVNPALCDITGYSKKELLAMKLDDLEVQESPGQIKRHIEKIIKKGSDRFETKHRRKDGRILDIEVSTQFCDFDKDKFLFSFFRDITPRKQAEAEAYLAHQELRAAFNAIHENMNIVDLEFNLVHVNETLLRNFDLPGAEHVIGRKCFEALKGREGICPDCAVTEVYRTKTPVHRVTTSEDEASTGGRRFEIFAYPIMDEHGRLYGAVEFARDITERRRIEAELEKYRERVSQTQKYAYVNSIGAIVAHQLNQPLTMINMLLGRALEQAKDESCCPPVLKYVKESLEEAKNAARIISEVRQYSRNSAWVVGGAVVIADITNKIVSMLSERAELAKMTIFVKDMDDLPEVEINETALEQIFFIIIQNAIEAADGKKGHKLTISAGQTDKKVELRFSDDCCGIVPENLEKIFEPFFTTKSHGGRMGLGLEIVRHILVACGGEIRVESQPGKGSTFYVTLPISSDVNT